jgi:CubicO group peptidase (beta-lactamase class C family)
MAAEMFQRVDGFGYGLGAAVRGNGNRLLLMKRGHNTGFQCYMMMFPDAGHGGVVMTNAESGDRLIEPFLRAVAARDGWPPIGNFAD